MIIDYYEPILMIIANEPASRNPRSRGHLESRIGGTAGDYPLDPPRNFGPEPGVKMPRSFFLDLFQVGVPQPYPNPTLTLQKTLP